MSTTKTVCPVSREEFNIRAKAVPVQINGTTVYANPKPFTTGSFGWHYGDKVMLEVGGTTCKVQVGLVLTVVGSKELPPA